MRKRYIAAIMASIILVAILGSTSVPHSNRIVALYYYPWYGNGLGGRHWNDTIYTPVIDKPLIGYYSSMDESAIKWQLNLMKQAGIDVLFISWWGPGSYEDQAARLVFKLCKEYGLKACILVEPYLGSDPSLYDYEFWKNVLDYIDCCYVEPYSDVYFRLNGKPLVLAFNPIGEDCKPQDPRFTIRIIGNDVDNGGYRDWDLWPDYLAPWTEPRDSIELRVRSDGYVAITPRFDDRIFEVLGVRTGSLERLIDPDYTLHAYQQQWEWVLKHKDEISIVAIYSWNEYHERSMIEPHFDATKPSNLYDPYQLTVDYVKEFKEEGDPIRSFTLNLLGLMTMLFLLSALSKLKLR